MKFTIINGPNLNLLGTREPHIYGKENFEDYFTTLQKQFHNHELIYKQSNVEGELVNFLQQAANDDGIILNAAAYTHTSLAISDAVAAIDAPVIEVHISNVMAREEIRHHSLISAHCVGSISGLGLKGYQLALYFLIDYGKR